MHETMVLYVVLPLAGVFAVGWTVWMIAIQRRDDASKRRADAQNAARWTASSAQLDAQPAAQSAATTYLLSAGTPATAQILSADTGGRLVIVQGKQECRIGLRVQIPGGQPYQASWKFPECQVGAAIAASAPSWIGRRAPDDPTRQAP